MTTDAGTEKLLRDLRSLPTTDDKETDKDIRIRYSYLFCEVCETNMRQLLVRFTDGSVFTLCQDCGLDLATVVELFNLDCCIERF